MLIINIKGNQILIEVYVKVLDIFLHIIIRPKIKNSLS